MEIKIKINKELYSILYFLLVFFTAVTFRNRGVNSSGMDWQLMIKSFYWILCFFISLYCFRLYVFKLIGIPGKLMVFYSIFAFVSFSWSPNLFYSFSASLVFLIYVTFYLSMSRFLSDDEVYLIFWKSGVFFLIASIVAYLFSPDMVLQEYWSDLGYIKGARYKGLATDSNAIGQISLVTALLTVIAYDRQLVGFKTGFFVVILAGFSLYFSWSRTSILALIAALSYYYIFPKKEIRIISFIVIFLLIIVLFIIKNDLPYILSGFSRSGGVEELTTFTGRVYIWEVVWELIKDAPYLGYGYASSKTLIPMNFETSWGWTTVNSHSFILQLILSTGFLGSLPIIILVGYQALNLIRFKNRVQSTVFIVVLLTGALESGAIGPIPNYMTLFWMFSIYFFFPERVLK